MMSSELSSKTWTYRESSGPSSLKAEQRYVLIRGSGGQVTPGAQLGNPQPDRGRIKQQVASLHALSSLQPSQRKWRCPRVSKERRVGGNGCMPAGKEPSLPPSGSKHG